MNKRWKHGTIGIPDEYFLRGKVPMTKEEVRAVTLSKLRINQDSKILDIGAGTGSISIEAAIQAPQGKVYSIEKKTEAVRLIEDNMASFGITNMVVKEGVAPEDCDFDGVMFDRIFMGGTSGKMDLILKWCLGRLNPEGRVVINTITIENTYHAIESLKKLDYKNIDVALVQVSKGRFVGSVTMMEGYNPVYVISADIE